MKLSLKITLLLFVITTTFIIVLSFFFYSQLDRNYREQADKLLGQSVALTEQRLQLLHDRLQTELQSLATSFFAENENTIAAMLADPPVFDAGVVGFAERLRRRTSLDFLVITTSSGIILSNSLEPAAFGKNDLFSTLPTDAPVYVSDSSAAVELKKEVSFGKHIIHLRGGCFLRSQLEKISIPGIRLNYVESGESTFIAKSDAAVLAHTLPFKNPEGKTVASLAVAISQQELLEQKDQVITNGVYLLIGSMFLCLLIGSLISFSLTRPLGRLTAASREMSEGNFAVRVPDGGSGETKELVRTFNKMVEQLDENRKKLIQTERIAAWQEIARYLAHEIKNPLTPIRTSLANLRLAMERAPEKFPEIFRESSQSIIEEVETLRHLADEFARFARLPAPNLALNRLNDVLQRAVSLYSNALPAEVSLQFRPSAVPPLYFDAEQILQAAGNLLQNSLEAIHSKGEIVMSTGVVEHNGKQWALVRVQDSGTGMTEIIKQQVFTPYFTTKPKGTGLGLALVHRIVTEHGGNILVESEPEKGTVFEVYLPIQ